MLIEARKGVYYHFCPECFTLLEQEELKNIRKIIKIRKNGVIIE